MIWYEMAKVNQSKAGYCSNIRKLRSLWTMRQLRQLRQIPSYLHIYIDIYIYFRLKHYSFVYIYIYIHITINYINKKSLTPYFAIHYTIYIQSYYIYTQYYTYIHLFVYKWNFACILSATSCLSSMCLYQICHLRQVNILCRCYNNQDGHGINEMSAPSWYKSCLDIFIGHQSP